MFIEIMIDKSIAININSIVSVERINDLHCRVITENGEEYKSDYPKNVILNFIASNKAGRNESSARP